MKDDDKGQWGHFKKVLDDYRPEFEEKSWAALREKLKPVSSIPFTKSTFLKLQKLAIACSVASAILASTYWMMESRQSPKKTASKFRAAERAAFLLHSAKADTIRKVEQKAAMVATNTDLPEAASAINNTRKYKDPSRQTTPEKHIAITHRDIRDTDTTEYTGSVSTAYTPISRANQVLHIQQSASNPPSVHGKVEVGSHRMPKLYELSFAYSPLILQSFRGNLIHSSGWSVGIGRYITDKYMVYGEVSLSSLSYDASLNGLPLYTPNIPTSRDLLHTLTAGQVRSGDSASIWCCMSYLEIGASISRTLMSRTSSRLDILAGFSTYLMLKESYADTFTIGDSTFLFHEKYGAFESTPIPFNVSFGARWQQQLSEYLGVTLSSTYTLAVAGAGATRQKWNSLDLKAGVTLSIGRIKRSYPKLEN